jgi:phospholipid transport system substrate-binding protein
MQTSSTIVTHHPGLQRHPALAVTADGVVGHISNSPTDAVKDTVAEFLSILGDEALKEPRRSGERRYLVEQVIRNGVNCEETARRALGLPWKQLTETERQDFVSAFIQVLRDMFGNKIDEYHNARMRYLSERRHDGFAEVRTILVGSKVDTSVDFRLGSQSGHWLIYDLVIDGASMVSNYKAQFDHIIRDDSYAGLMEKMRQRNLLAKVFERTVPARATSSILTAPQ